MKWIKGWHKKTKYLCKLFLITVAVTASLCGVAMGLGVMIWNTYLVQDEIKVTSDSETDNQQVDKEPKEETAQEKVEEVKEEKAVIHKTMAVLGVDKEGYRTDVIIVAHFNSETNEADVIAVPRDTHVTWSEEQKAYLKEGNGWVRESKLNEMTAYTGIEGVRGGTIDYLENLLGTKVDNYIMIDTDAFKKIVDAVGGVTLEVPQRMKYDDYSQELHIDLQPGLQTLDGEDAEGFVRYRGDYAMGDVQRIEVQRVFLEAFVEKVMTPRILLDIPGIAEVVFSSIKTDLKMQDIPQYIPYITTFNTNKLYFHTIEGEYERIDNKEYYVVDAKAASRVATNIFY